MTMRNPIPWALGLIALVILLSSIFAVVPETKQALIVRLGNPYAVVNKYEPNEAFGHTGAGERTTVSFVSPKTKSIGLPLFALASIDLASSLTTCDFTMSG